MDKYDYITATIEEEKIRLEKLIKFLEDSNNIDDIIEYKERYNNICKYLNSKSKYLNILNNIERYKNKLNDLNKLKDEYEVDNILLEDTLLNIFNEDTNNIYRNLLYEDIKNQDKSVRDILFLLYEKESNYKSIVVKRNKLLKLVDKNIYPKTYDTLVSQSILIDKQDSILDEIFVLENNIKIENEKAEAEERSVMTPPILKILYEFWIVDSYNPIKVDYNIVFNDNKNFINFKNDIVDDIKEFEEVNNVENVVDDNDFKLMPDLNLPGIDEYTFVDIDGKDYVKNDK